MIIPEWVFKEEQAHIKIKTKKVCKPKTLKQIARENNKSNDNELVQELAKKMITPYFLLTNFQNLVSKLI